MSTFGVREFNGLGGLIAPAARFVSVTPTAVVWVTASGQTIEARGTGLLVSTVAGQPVFGGLISSFTILNAGGVTVFTAGDLHLPFSNAAAGLQIASLFNGNDTFSKLSTARVQFDGKDGFDMVDYSSINTAVVANLGNSTLNRLGATGDTYSGIEGLVGGRFNDALTGNDLRNTLIGGGGNDTLSGMGGDDVLEGGTGVDRFNGGTGFDFVDYGRATRGVTVNLGDSRLNGGEAAGETYVSIEGVFGSAFGDSLNGDNNSNTLIGGAGNDYVGGLGGNDVLRGDEGNDQLVGGLGDDVLEGGAGDDTLVGEAGLDNFDGGTGFDFASYFNAARGVTVNLGNSLFNGGEAAGETYVSIEGVFGSAFGDSLNGDNNANVLFGGAGDDYLGGLSGDDVLKGDDGRDQLVGGFGNDTLEGGAGDDTLVGEAGQDNFNGGTGFDFASYYNATSGVTVNLGNSLFNGGEAAGETYISIEGVFGSAFGDSLNGDNNANVLFGGAGDDYLGGLSGHDVLKGDAGNDQLIGGFGNDTLEGGAGFDTLVGEAGIDNFNGGADFDFASYYNATSGVTVNLGNSLFNGGEAAGETYISIEGVFGSAFGDSLNGDNNANVLFGGAGDDYLGGLGGDDVLKGEDGIDQLVGGLGNDTLDGGAGRDTFIFGNLPFGHDLVTDFKAFSAAGIQSDRLDFRGATPSSLAMSQVGHDTLISTSAGTVLLQGVNVSSLSSVDFIF